MTRLSNDTSQLQKALSQSLVGAARNSTLAVGCTAALIATSPSLAAASLASFPPVFAYAAWKGRHMRKQQAAVQKTQVGVVVDKSTYLCFLVRSFILFCAPFLFGILFLLLDLFSSLSYH